MTNEELIILVALEDIKFAIVGIGGGFTRQRRTLLVKDSRYWGVYTHNWGRLESLGATSIVYEDKPAPEHITQLNQYYHDR